MDLTFQHPSYLYLVLLIPLLWFVPSRLRDVTHGLLRSVVFLALVIGLARPMALSGGGKDTVVYVLDRTESVAPEERQRALAAVERRVSADSGRSHLVVMGAWPDLARVAERSFVSSVQLQGSSLSDALEAAEATIPALTRGAIVVLSDGASIDRRYGPVAERLAHRGIPVHEVPLTSVPREAVPIALRRRGTWRVGSTARLQVEVVGSASTVRARLSIEGEDLQPFEISLRGGRGRRIVEFEPRRAGFVLVTVELFTDRVPEDARRMTELFAVQDPFRVLYLGERMISGGDAIARLVGPGFQVEQPAPGARTADFSAYDLVVADDIPARSLPEDQQRALVAAVVEEGLGLFVSGGSAAFGPGGYTRSPLSEVMPVEFVQKEEKRDPSTTLVVIIDTSGSMGGERVILAKETARLAIRRLLPHDKVGIVEFYGNKHWAAPIQPASNAIEIQRALNRLDAGGGTVILPAIEEAFYGLQNVQTRYKHVLILTDAGVEQGAFEPLLRKMADEGINVSTVLVGPDAHSEFLVTLSNWGKGRYYSVPDRFNLPEILLKQPSTTRLPGYRPGEHQVQVHGDGTWWGETRPQQVPSVQGYVETRPRPNAEVLLETLPAHHPLLASWRYGLGRVTAFMTEPTGPGTRPWQDWPEYGKTLARVWTRTAGEGGPPFGFELQRRDHTIRIQARRIDGSALVPAARLVGADDPDLVFREHAPGYFVAERVLAPEREARILAGVLGHPERGQVRLASGAYSDRAAELQVDPRRDRDLLRIVRGTGGRQFSPSDLPTAQVEVGGAAGTLTAISLWPWAILLGILAYGGDLAHRRSPNRKRKDPGA